MKDPFAVLDDHLADAARRIEASAASTASTSSRRPLRRRTWWLMASVAALAVSGSATAAIVTLNSRDSKPLAGSLTQHVKGAPDHYRLGLVPDLTLGANGWCATAATSDKQQPATFGANCGRAPRSGSLLVAGGLSSVSSTRAMLFLIVDRRVAAVTLHDGRRVRARAATQLPRGDRLIAATVSAHAYRPDSSFLRFTLLGSQGQALAAGDLRDVYSASRVVAQPSRSTVDPLCSLTAPDSTASLTRSMHIDQGDLIDATGAAYLSCATATAHSRGIAFRVAVLVAPTRAKAPEDLPGAGRPHAGVVEANGGISARALPGGWLVVEGGVPSQRADLLSRLRASIDR